MSALNASYCSNTVNSRKYSVRRHYRGEYYMEHLSLFRPAPRIALSSGKKKSSMQLELHRDDS
jgi:hypothetical protein